MSFILLYQLKGNAKEATIDVVKFQEGLRQCLHRSPATGFTLAYPAKNWRVYLVSQAVGAHSKKQNKQLIDPQFCFKATRSFWFFFPLVSTVASSFRPKMPTMMPCNRPTVLKARRGHGGTLVVACQTLMGCIIMVDIYRAILEWNGRHLEDICIH